MPASNVEWVPDKSNDGAPTLTAESERRLVAVLFVDFVGFTEFTARAGAENAHGLMQRISPLLHSTVQEQGCVIRNFTGDGIVAFFGLPATLEDAPLRACRAALLIEQRLASAAPAIVASFGVWPRLRMSVDSGLVVYGALMEGDSASFTAHGDAVNLGSRLLGVAAPGTILISEQTQRYVDGFVESRHAGTFQLKGLAEPRTGYRLLSLLEGTTRFAAARRRGLTEFVGRSGELDSLEATLRDLRSPRVVDIAGEPGIGKSRLLHEFMRRFASEDFVVLSGSCSSDGQQTPFLPFIDVVRRSFQFTAGEMRGVVAAKIEEGLRRLGLGARENSDLLLNLLGLAEPDALRGLDGALIGLRTRDLLLQLIGAHSRLSTLVLHFEDLHWIDSASEELLARLIDANATRPLLVLHTRRPEYHPPWRDHACVHPLYLAPLSANETLQIVGARLGVARMPEALGGLIAARADGNALFAEEIAGFLVERGIVRPTAEGIDYDSPSVAAALPGTLQALLTVSIDRLGDADRSLLQVASVMGQRFDLALLAAIVGESDDRVRERLAAIEPAGLVQRDAATGEYAFKHVLMRDALYESLVTAARVDLHAKVAKQIEANSHDRLIEVAEILAYHYSLTDQPEPTFHYLCLAGRKSLDIYSLEEAEQYFRRAVDTHPAAAKRAGASRMATAVVGLLEALYLAGNVLEVKRVAERNLPTLEREGDSPELVFALYFLSLMLANLRKFREGEVRVRQALAIATRIGDNKAIAYARSGLYFLSIVLGRTSREAMAAMAALLLAECQNASDNYILNWAYWSIAYDSMTCGRIAEARGWIAKLVETGRERKDQRALGMAYWSLSWIEIHAHNYAEAARNADEALKTAVAPYDRNAASQVKAVAMLLQGRIEEGFTQMRAARQWALDAGWHYAASGADMSIAGALAQRGEIKSAFVLLNAAIKAADADGSRAIAAWNRVVLAELYIAGLTSTVRPSLGVIARNISSILGIVAFGSRRARALLADVRNNEQFDEFGTMRARLEFDLGVLALHEKRLEESRSHFDHARAAATAQSATEIVAEIEAASAGLRSKAATIP